MGVRKSGQSDIRSLTKSGGGKSLGLTLPIEIIRKLGWRERQKVKTKLKGRKIVVEDWKK